MSTTENNKAVVLKFLEEVINQNRMDRADELVVEDFVELDPLSGQRQGRDGFLGVPATGKRVSVKGIVIDQLLNGKMSKSRILMDSLGMMQQLGAIPSA